MQGLTRREEVKYTDSPSWSRTFSKKQSSIINFFRIYVIGSDDKRMFFSTKARPVCPEGGAQTNMTFGLF